jgi:integrase
MMEGHIFTRKIPMLVDFLNKYRAKTTRAMYMSAWVKFLSLLYNARLKGASPETLDPWVAKYVNDLRNGRRDLALDLQALGEHCRTRKTFLGYQSAIRTYLAGEDLSLAPSGRVLLRSTRSPRPQTRDEPLTPGDLLKILDHLDTRGRAILYVLASSGARLGEVLSIRLRDLDLDARPARFRIRDEAGRVSRMAFISREAVGAIRVYLIVRDRYAASARSRGGTGDPLLLFPLGPRAFEQVWALALSKARVERFDPVTHRRTITPRAARRFFAERMRTALPEPPVGEMLGNARHVPGPYRRYTDEELAGAYLKGEPAITLHRSHRKERVTKRIADLERLVGILHEKIGERDEELARIRETITGNRGWDQGRTAGAGDRPRRS